MVCFKFPVWEWSIDERNNASAACRQLYDEVQFAHMALAKTRRDWPRFVVPKGKAVVIVADVVNGLTEENYRERINAWGNKVWDWWKPELRAWQN
ncbi:MAG: hypothetical protein Q7R50_06470 [Dehalococcoidales bacterium]|nr:hypothetical protein [Dehalococcoidales bacterium]